MDLQMMAFNVTKGVVMAQNTDLLRRISEEYGLDADEMLRTYLKPEFYLVVFEKHLFKSNSPADNAQQH